MNSRTLSLLAAFLILGAAAIYGETVGRARTFYLTYEVTVEHIPPRARRVRVWIPVASSDAHQTVQIARVSASVPVRITRRRARGNRMLYAEIDHPRSAENKFKIVYRVTRRSYSQGNYASLERYHQDSGATPMLLTRYLKPDRLIPTNGTIAEIAREATRGKQGEIDKAYALYNYVFRNMRYDKSGKGWGRGDALWACDAKRGNCTDFHSLFIALARAQKIPARFDIGFALPANARQGRIAGYHCWSEFYSDGLGWVPVDISEAWLSPSKHDYFFGSLDANRVQFSSGRDLTLVPPQGGEPVNYFIYPYVEVDGKPFNSVEKRFSFRDLQPLRVALHSH